LIRFQNDDLDQTRQIATILASLFPEKVTLRQLQGNHLTPLGQTLTWQSQGAFSPLDALGQWFQQEFFRDQRQLEQTILEWLNPLLTFTALQFV
jgi:hypothetical protein